MSKEDDVSAAVDLIYEALLDDALWPKALMRLTDVMGAAQVGLLSLDRRARSYDSLAPRTDPVMDASFKSYWAFHNPLWPRTIMRPAGEAFLLESLVPRDDLTATAFFHEWFRPAGFGFAAIGANLEVASDVSSMIAVGNAPGNDQITDDQIHIFKAAFRHLDRAVRIHHELRIRDLDHDTAPERLEHMTSGVILVDRAAKVLFANALARELIGSGIGLALEAGCLRSTDGSDALQRSIATCARKIHSLNGPGGETMIRRSQRQSLRVTVTPLRANGAVAELPWLGLQLPVAMVTVSKIPPKKIAKVTNMYVP
jgi:hypothetical protein